MLALRTGVQMNQDLAGGHLGLHRLLVYMKRKFYSTSKLSAITLQANALPDSLSTLILS